MNTRDLIQLAYELAGLRRVLEGVPAAPCALTSCIICHCPFNPLAVRCGGVICPRCLDGCDEVEAARCWPCSTKALLCAVRRHEITARAA